MKLITKKSKTKPEEKLQTLSKHKSYRKYLASSVKESIFSGDIQFYGLGRRPILVFRLCYSTIQDVTLSDVILLRCNFRVGRIGC